MKVTGILSAIVFAHVAMGQAANSTSAAASTSASGASSGSSSASNAIPTGSLTESITGDSNPLLPTDISAGCSTFLTTLNSDTTMSDCLTPLITALSQFNSDSTPSSAVSKALTAVCSSNACSPTVMRTKLTEFKDACSADFASNEVVAKQYDVWYSFLPFKSAICVKDDDSYCVLKSASASTTSNTRRSDVSYAASHLTNSISKRAQTVLMPNTDTYRGSNLMYLFNSPDKSSEDLCTPCTKKIVAKYIAFESSTPHALGVSKSPLLGGQSQLWAAMQEKCTPEYMADVSNVAGVATADELASGAVTTSASYVTALVAAFTAAFALF